MCESKQPGGLRGYELLRLVVIAAVMILERLALGLSRILLSLHCYKAWRFSLAFLSVIHGCRVQWQQE
jgi:hypothetical protein